MRQLVKTCILMVLAVSSAYAQWTEPVRISEPGGGYDPDIMAQGDTLHVVYNNNNGGWKIDYLRSTDGGNTWSEHAVLSDTVNTTQTHYPHILRNGNSLMVVWQCYYWQGYYHYNIGFRISNNNGLTWEAADYIINPGWTFPFYLSATGAGSNINIMASGAPISTMIFYNIRSTDFGQSWSEPIELFRTAQGGKMNQSTFQSIIHYIWSGRFTYEEKKEIYYMRSTNAGISWSQSIPLSDIDLHHSQLPAINADNFGNVAATWMDFKYAPPGATGDIFIRQSADSGSDWTAENQLTFSHYAFGSDVILDMDTVHVAWEDESQGFISGRIYYIKSTDNGVNWSEQYWVDGTDDNSWNPAIAASNGKVYVVWYDERHYPDTIGLYFSRYHDQTGFIEEEDIVLRFELLETFPNPFNSKVIILLNMIKGGETEIGIYDINGRLVKTIFKRGNLEKGTHKFTWDATDASGKAVSSGLYFAVAGTPQGKFTKTLTLIR